MLWPAIAVEVGVLIAASTRHIQVPMQSVRSSESIKQIKPLPRQRAVGVNPGVNMSQLKESGFNAEVHVESDLRATVAPELRPTDITVIMIILNMFEYQPDQLHIATHSQPPLRNGRLTGVGALPQPTPARGIVMHPHSSLPKKYLALLIFNGAGIFIAYLESGSG